MIRGNKKDIEEFINDIKVNRSNIYNNELKDILDKIETQFKLIDTIFNMI